MGGWSWSLAERLRTMGCKLARALAREQPGGEVDNKDLPDPPAPAPLDPRLPLTARQKFSMVKSWKGISRALEPTGVYMFLQ